MSKPGSLAPTDADESRPCGGGILLVVGNDKIGRRLLDALPRNGGPHVVIDGSGSPRRVLRLLRRRVLRISDVLRMAFAEWRREDTGHDVSALPRIRSNDDLLEMIRTFGTRRVYLFRAGLIVDRKVLDAPVEVMNIHCASLNGFGGLASIRRALEQGAWQQCATLHRVTSRIDEGEVLREEPYQLSPKMSYRRNEDEAYAAGIRLALQILCERGVV